MHEGYACKLPLTYVPENRVKPKTSADSTIRVLSLSRFCLDSLGNSVRLSGVCLLSQFSIQTISNIWWSFANALRVLGVWWNESFQMTSSEMSIWQKKVATTVIWKIICNRFCHEHNFKIFLNDSLNYHHESPIYRKLFCSEWVILQHKWKNKRKILI